MDCKSFEGGHFENCPGLKTNETHVPAEPNQTGTHTWISSAHGNKGRAPYSEAPPRERTRAAFAVVIRAFSVTTDNKHKQKYATSRRFSRENRLLDAAAFRRVFKSADRSRDELFTVLSSKGRRKGARLGLAISKRNCRLAVQRNRVKRAVRESFRLHKEDLDGLDVVVMCQVAAARASNKKLFESLDAHWQRCRNAAG